MLPRKFVLGIILIFISFSLCIFVSKVLANVPQIEEINVLNNNADTLLEVTFVHNPVTSDHYASEIEVDVDGVLKIYQISQDSTTFTAKINLGQVIGTPLARVRVYCTFDGWSSWSNQQTIPEFQSWIILPLILAITLFSILLKRKLCARPVCVGSF